VSSEDIANHFRLWIRAGMTGCEFAKRLSGKADHVAIALHLDRDVPATEWFESVFDPNSDADRAVVAVFPLISSEHAVVEFINALDRVRWRIQRRTKPSPTGGVLIGMDWTTKNGDVSEAMGFAPILSMPVPRRAPYVAIAMWPGGRSNPFRGQGSTPAARPGVVSFLDAKHGLAEAEYEARWAETTDGVTKLMTMPPDDAKLYRRTAFVISPEAAVRLAVD
jgi:hypothetical protein